MCQCFNLIWSYSQIGVRVKKGFPSEDKLSIFLSWLVCSCPTCVMQAPVNATITATTLTVSWNCRNLEMLSYTFLPHMTAFTMLEKLSSVRMMSDASFATSVPAIPWKEGAGSGNSDPVLSHLDKKTAYSLLQYDRAPLQSIIWSDHSMPVSAR